MGCARTNNKRSSPVPSRFLQDRRSEVAKTQTLRSEERRVGKECRSLCDWSSDVCSSDLFSLPLAHGLGARGRENARTRINARFARPDRFFFRATLWDALAQTTSARRLCQAGSCRTGGVRWRKHKPSRFPSACLIACKQRRCASWMPAASPLIRSLVTCGRSLIFLEVLGQGQPGSRSNAISSRAVDTAIDKNGARWNRQAEYCGHRRAASRFSRRLCPCCPRD